MRPIKINAMTSRAIAIASIAGLLLTSTAAVGGDADASQSKIASISRLLQQSGLTDLVPCRAEAARHCDWSSGKTASSLLRCGATLAAISDQIGNHCRRVVQQYGQLN